jgi:hypothetical protein
MADPDADHRLGPLASLNSNLRDDVRTFSAVLPFRATSLSPFQSLEIAGY